MEMTKLREPTIPATVTPGRDGTDDLRVLILGARSFIAGTKSAEAIAALTEGFKNHDVSLLGCYVARAICHCEKQCPEGSLYGFTLPRTDKSVSAIMSFFINLDGLEIKDTTDPEVNRGVFKAYLDAE